MEASKTETRDPQKKDLFYASFHTVKWLCGSLLCDEWLTDESMDVIKKMGLGINTDTEDLLSGSWTVFGREIA